MMFWVILGIIAVISWAYIFRDAWREHQIELRFQSWLKGDKEEDAAHNG